MMSLLLNALAIANEHSTLLLVKPLTHYNMNTQKIQHCLPPGHLHGLATSVRGPLVQWTISSQNMTQREHSDSA